MSGGALVRRRHRNSHDHVNVDSGAQRGRAAGRPHGAGHRCGSACRARARPRHQRKIHGPAHDGRAAHRVRADLRARADHRRCAVADRAARSRPGRVAGRRARAAVDAPARHAVGTVGAAAHDARPDLAEPVQHRPVVQARSAGHDSRRGDFRPARRLFARVPAVVPLRVLDDQATRAPPRDGVAFLARAAGRKVAHIAGARVGRAEMRSIISTGSTPTPACCRD